jgi:hypothetical protein
MPYAPRRRRRRRKEEEEEEIRRRRRRRRLLCITPQWVQCLEAFRPTGRTEEKLYPFFSPDYGSRFSLDWITRV